MSSGNACLLFSLFLAWAWSIIAGSMGLNALIKSNQQQTRIRQALPPGASVSFNVHDIYTTGVVQTTVCWLIVLLTFIYFIQTLAKPSRGWFALQAWTLGLCTVWLFAVQIAYDQFVRTRSAQVYVTVGGVVVAPNVIQRVENTLGVTWVYRHVYFIRLAAIFPWFAILFTAIATAAAAAAHVDTPRTVKKKTHQPQASSEGTAAAPMTEKDAEPTSNV